MSNLDRTLPLTGNTTVNFNSTMTAAEIQALIDSTPHNLNGYTLNFQFADGTYTIGTSLLFSGFYNGGTLNIQGNTGEANALHTTQAVFLNASTIAASQIPVYIRASDVQIYLKFLKIQIPDTSGVQAIGVYGCTWAAVHANYILGSGKVNGTYGISNIHSLAYAYNNYISNVTYGIYASRSRVMSYNNDDTGTPPTTGLWSIDSATIGKNGTQPAGSNANEQTGTGGVIR